MSKNKAIDLAVILLLIGAGLALWFWFYLKPLWGMMLITIPPSLYLGIRAKKNLKKIGVATAVIGGLFGFVCDLIQTAGNAWQIKRLVFPWKVVGILPLDDILGVLLMTLFVIMFYEHFLNRERRGALYTYLYVGVVPVVVVGIGVVILFYFLSWEITSVPYVYLVGGVLAIIPLVYMGIYKPTLRRRLLYLVPFFFLVWLALEIVTLKTNGLVFPGTYVGEISVLGVTFPWEELFFWMILYAPGVASYYEFLVDDIK